MELRLFIKNQSRCKIDKHGFEKILGRILLDKEIEGKIELSLLVCGPKFAQKLNWQYRKMKYVPQVLGFPMSREADVDGFLRLGDIVICYQKLRKEAIMMKKTEGRIWEEWLKHGIDNLLK
jgi:rRNA maturation RNase YbeY